MTEEWSGQWYQRQQIYQTEKEERTRVVFIESREKVIDDLEKSMNFLLLFLFVCRVIKKWMFVFSPDIIPIGGLGSKHQRNNLLVLDNNNCIERPISIFYPWKVGVSYECSLMHEPEL